MGFFDSISDGIKNHFSKKDEEREMMEKLQKEANMIRRQEFEDHFREDAKKVAISKAKSDAARLSGLQSLRATNRARRLSNDPPTPGTFFGRMSELTQQNKARMQENLARTAEMRGKAEKLKQEKMDRIISERNQRMPNKGDGLARAGSTWKM